MGRVFTSVPEITGVLQGQWKFLRRSFPWEGCGACGHPVPFPAPRLPPSHPPAPLSPGGGASGSPGDRWRQFCVGAAGGTAAASSLRPCQLMLCSPPGRPRAPVSLGLHPLAAGRLRTPPRAPAPGCTLAAPFRSGPGCPHLASSARTKPGSALASLPLCAVVAVCVQTPRVPTALSGSVCGRVCVCAGACACACGGATPVDWFQPPPCKPGRGLTTTPDEP